MEIISKKDGEVLANVAMEADGTYNLDGLNLENGLFDSLDLSKCSFRGTNLRSARIVDCSAEGADFTGCYLDHATFSRTSLRYANFTNVSMDYIDFYNSNIHGAIFRDVDLSCVTLPVGESDFPVFGGSSIDNIRHREDVLKNSLPLHSRYISTSLMSRLLNVRDNPLVYKLYDIYIKEADGKGIKNLTVNKKGKLTFLPKGKESILCADGNYLTWSKNNRQEGNFGKTLRKLLVENGYKDHIEPVHIEELTNSLKAEYTLDGIFKIVSGEDIRKYYLEKNYDSRYNMGTMGNSCMRYSGPCQTACNIYVHNENCELVILKAPDNDSSRGRALLWTDEDGQKWMDRIYANDHVITAFKQFAQSKEWNHKKYQDSESGKWKLPNGEEVYKDVRIKLEDVDYRPLPYMDTFFYVYRNEGYVSSESISSFDGYIYAQEVPEEGDENREWDGYEECWISDDEAVYLENRGYFTHMGNCTICGITGRWAHDNDLVTLEDGRQVDKECGDIFQFDNGEWYHRDDVGYCEYNDEDYPDKYLTFVEDLNMNIHQDSVDDAYEAAGWVKDEDGNWAEESEVEV